MHIGEKIKSLRQSKLMTQTELAGNYITRNMLSSIEHGSAMPSLPTALYIAERLNVPVGYLLAEEGDEPGYRKMTAISNIRRALLAKDYTGTLALIQVAQGESADDELSLIRAQCEMGIACESIKEGRLRAAAQALDAALRAAGESIYDTEWIRSRAGVCFKYLSGVSATLSSDVLDADEIDRARTMGDELCEYAQALLKLEAKEIVAVKEYLERYPQSLYAVRIRALLLMQEENYVDAQSLLEGLLSHDSLTFGLLLYEVFGDLEICYRKNDDYKRAYEFSSSRLELLERLLEEI